MELKKMMKFVLPVPIDVQSCEEVFFFFLLFSRE
jgi:hypothetical protein